MLILEYFIIVDVNQASFYTIISYSILKSTPLFRRMSQPITSRVYQRLLYLFYHLGKLVN